MRCTILNRLLLTCLLALGLTAPALAAETQVAVAANFTEPAKEIAAGFQRATGHRAILSFGASGAFYAQIAHGAPFEVFLSADAERPAQAEKDGFVVPRTRFTYAIGRLVLYSPDPVLIDGRGIVLRRGIFDKLAIADPAAAPYGLAAIQTINALGLGGTVGPRLVKGASIAQAFQFVQSGAAQLGFVAQSQVIGIAGGSRWLVPADLHAPIEQQAVLLKTGAANPVARAFLTYLRGPEARAVIQRYGYEIR
ncbi:molybdate transport system substrate-binding protein [Sphingomonas vulcanisoli]|uniref:Molybdate transport system substrate-binding protein n=1 Tax=Sphingomonas vulcanisoli TaxID=1658060 RepID=A0ABX0TU59_9SPHN|nr:molybdate ABC transporter substrate-binding protein [Sphingomonas vulcanisoli]NIJ08015.1 molybdate transport system substrate-binding protein [Sphingomonas vulcanisoli]